MADEIFWFVKLQFGEVSKGRAWPPLRGGWHGLSRDWGSVSLMIEHSLRPRLRSATSLKEGGKATIQHLYK